MAETRPDLVSPGTCSVYAVLTALWSRLTVTYFLAVKASAMSACLSMVMTRGVHSVSLQG